MIEKSSIYQIVIKKRMALGCIGKMPIVSLKVPFHKANESRWRLPESKNRSTVKARFRRPRIKPFLKKKFAERGIPIPTGFDEKHVDLSEVYCSNRLRQLQAIATQR